PAVADQDESHIIARRDRFMTMTRRLCRSPSRLRRLGFLFGAILWTVVCARPALADTPRLTLVEMVTPSTVFLKNDQPVKFALNGFIEFQTLSDLFAYVDAQAGRWTFGSAEERQAFGDALLGRGVESRLISM